MPQIIDIKDLPKAIEKKAKSMRFAGVVSLTWTAKDAQAAVKKSLAKKFTLRNPWTQRGLRITPAKTGQTEPFAEVYHIDEFIAQHEKTQKRTAFQVGGEFWIPLPSFYKYFKKDKKKRIPKSLRPRSIINKKIRGKVPFKATAKGGLYLFLETRKGGYIGLYKIQKEPIQIKDRNWFYTTVDKTYDKKFEKNYDKAVRKFVK
jgi:hypothetical protein